MEDRMEFESLRNRRWIQAFVVGAAVLVCSSGRPVPSSVQRIALRRHHGPASIHRQVNQTTSESYNWSGYAVTGAKGSVTDVKSSWRVPAVTCPHVHNLDSDGYASFWTGIDGWTSNTVEQIGTDSDCLNLLGTQTAPTYYAWFEFYPADSFLVGKYNNKTGACISDCVKPGDVITAEVESSTSGPKGPGPGHGPGPGGGLKFTATITDVTQGWTFSTTSTVPGAQQSSAEWIAETPFGCNTSSGYCPLPDFGIVDYGSFFTGVASTASATVGTSSGPIGSFGSNVQESVMVDYPSGTTVMAQPSNLKNSDSFSINWLNAGP
jgi:hypothetical protein